MKWFNYVCLAFVVAFILSCNDEELIGGKVKEGLPASMNLTIEVPVADTVEVTRGINDYESEMTELLLLMFSTTSPRQEFIDLSDNLVANPTTGGGYRTYTLKNDVITTSGVYRVYAIANFNSPYCQLSKDKLIKMSEDEVKAALAKNTNHYTMIGTERFPMSQVIESLEIKSDADMEDGENTNKLELSLKRIVSHIEFEFSNGEGVTFEPYEYKVYNLPTGANLINKEEGNLIPNERIENKEVSYFNSDTEKTKGRNFGFFMLENVQPEPESVTEYTLRDKWNANVGVATDGGKSFSNAPQYSTYIVVTGDYFGKTSVENETYSGKCTYTIHLGNFGSSSNGTRSNNFNVKRNEFHTYKVKITGVNTIAGEAIAQGSVEVDVNNNDGGGVPGAEGHLTYGKNMFILDSHYESIRIEISASTYTDILNSHTFKHKIVINTPKTKWVDEDVNLTYDEMKREYVPNIENADIEWIRFIKPADIALVPRYNADSKNVLEMLAKPEDVWLQSGDNYYTFAYVNEYFYEDIHPREFVNVMNRSFILDPNEEFGSWDKQSTVKQALIFDVSQRSIKSSFDMDLIDCDDTPYGVETWNETGGLVWTENTFTQSGILSKDQGRRNTLAMMNAATIENTIGSTYWQYIGYRHPVNDNTRARHRWFDEEHYQKFLSDKTYSGEDVNENINQYITEPLLAVLARNRILLENSEIDENSVQWYLPAINQYLISWLGQNSLPIDTRLMDITKFEAEDYSGDKMNATQHYYTSSNPEQRLYWQDQGACWGSWRSNQYNKMRCVRNLRNDYLYKEYINKHGGNGSYTDNWAYKNEAVQFPVEREGRFIKLGRIANSRSVYMTGGYGAHTEREPENYLYKAFEVADPSTGNFNDGTSKISNYCCEFSTPIDFLEVKNDDDIKTIANAMDKLAAAYYQNPDMSDLGQWRVPNQRELMLICLLNESESTPLIPLASPFISRVNILTTTWFTKYQKTQRTIPFLFDTGTESLYGSDNVMALIHDNPLKPRLIFVRDVLDNE